jgi:hypothetical protein
LLGFNINRCITELENHGFKWPDLNEAERLAILRRYKEHASWWGYKGDHIKLDLAGLAQRVETDPKSLLRQYYTLGKEKEAPKEDEDQKSDERDAERGDGPGS